MHRFTSLLLSALALPVALSVSSCQSSTAKEVQTAEMQDGEVVATQSAADEPASQTVTLAFTGDILMGTNLPDSSYITRDRGRSLFADCDSIIRSADLAIGNLEGACYYGTKAEITKNISSGKCFVFRMPGDHAQRLVDAGFDAVGIANNHAGDCGATGRRLTQENLRNVGIAFSGQKGGAEEAYIERNGVKYGYLAFAASCGNTNDMNNPASRDELIKKMRPQCDILVVSFHGGAEGTSACHVPFKSETFYGENRGDVHKFAHECIDRGADIVIGHGPHVPRAVELYNGHFIAYSLGNFCAPFRMSIAGATGLAPLLCVQLDAKTGQFQSGKIHSLKQVKGVGPRLDATCAAARNIGTLTKQDFPNGKLVVEDDGTITMK